MISTLMMGGSQHKKLKKLSITAYSTKTKAKKGEIELQINPESLNFDLEGETPDAEFGGYKISGSPESASAEPPSYKPMRLNFEFYLDATGVVKMPFSLKMKGITGWIEEFKNLTYYFHGTDHTPYYVKLGWGDVFKSRKFRTYKWRLKSLDIDYSLFNPDGEPLRAKLRCLFEEYFTPGEQQKIVQNSSPDLTHAVMVQSGDTLPLMCQRIYGNCAYYPEVARINGLSNVYRIKPGERLLFPPLS